MKKMWMISSLTTLILQSYGITSWANRVSDPDMPLSHCYHWLNERSNGYLAFKYNHASKNGGELTFYTTLATSNGSVAGAGLYCAKTPVGSYSYGDRVIRIEFVDDVVMSNGSRKACGVNGRFYSNQSDCDAKAVDVELYDTNSDWYVIKNPQAIKAWSANSDLLVSDLNSGKLDLPGASTHMDLTIQAMQSEVSKMGQKVIFNSQARLGLEKILKDQAQLDKIPLLSVIDMIASYSGDKVSEKEKSALYITYFDKALKDKVLSFSDFSNVIKNPTLKAVLISRIEKVNYSQLQVYNTSNLISAIDNLNLSITSDQAEKLWQVAFADTGSLDAILNVNLKKDSVFRKKFDSSLPSVAQLGNTLKDYNLIPTIKLLNEMADPKSNLKNYTEFLLEKLLKSSSNTQFGAIYDAITNPSLGKEQSLASLINKASNNNFTGLDPLGTSLLFEKVRNQFSSQQQKSIEADLMSLPLKVDNRLSYQLLEEYKARKFSLPDFYTEEAFLLHLVNRSINERSLGKNTTNTFRMIISGYYHYFTKSVADAKADKQPALDSAKETLLALASQLLKQKQNVYAYVALQNALFFASNMQVKEHPVETAIAMLNEGDAKLDQMLEGVIKTALDPSVLMYLADVEKGGRSVESLKAQKLLSSTLDYLASPEFKLELKSKDFIAGQAERKVWANVVNNKAYSQNGRVYSDICNFFSAYDKLKPQILASRSQLNSSSIEAAKALANASFCKKQDSNP